MNRRERRQLRFHAKSLPATITTLEEEVAKLEREHKTAKRIREILDAKPGLGGIQPRE